MNRYGRGPWNNIRFEFEGFHSDNDNDELKVLLDNVTGMTANADLEGDVTANGGTTNLCYDVPLSRFGPGYSNWAAYVGAGVGAVSVDVEARTASGLIADDGDTVLAYAVRRGFGYDIGARDPLRGLPLLRHP